MVHSLKAMSTKIAPGNTLRTLTTGKYRIHALFTASNLWIVIFSDLTHHELHERLDKIYELYLKYVVHNMLKPIDLRESENAKESDKITSPSFIKAVDQVLCL
ncbi:Bet5 [Kluyveromyces lactis]|nr:Bet5 [Kluyveromyces lactis]